MKNVRRFNYDEKFGELKVETLPGRVRTPAAPKRIQPEAADIATGNKADIISHPVMPAGICLAVTWW